jgi:hypothetical protein
MYYDMGNYWSQYRVGDRLCSSDRSNEMSNLSALARRNLEAICHQDIGFDRAKTGIHVVMVMMITNETSENEKVAS